MDAVTLALLKSLYGSGSSLPPVTSSDNGKVASVVDGAWAAQQKKFVVTLTPIAADFSGTMDHTVAEINSAYEAGQEIVFKMYTSEVSFIDVPVQLVGHENTYDYPSFEASVVQQSTNLLILAHTDVTNDGTRQTYSTNIYSLTPAS